MWGFHTPRREGGREGGRERWVCCYSTCIDSHIFVICFRNRFPLPPSLPPSLTLIDQVLRKNTSQGNILLGVRGGPRGLHRALLVHAPVVEAGGGERGREGGREGGVRYGLGQCIARRQWWRLWSAPSLARSHASRGSWGREGARERGRDGYLSSFRGHISGGREGGREGGLTGGRSTCTSRRCPAAC